MRRISPPDRWDVPPPPYGVTSATVALGCVGGSSLLIFGYFWWGRFQYDFRFYLLVTYLGVLLLIILSHWYFGDDRKRLGLRLDNLGESVRRSLRLTIVPAAGLILAGLIAGRFSPEALETIPPYLGWALVQQYALQNFLFLRFRSVLPHPPAAAVCAAALFGLFHLPNLPLVLMTFSGGLIWCWIFWKSPNLLSVTASHLILGSTAIVFFKYDGLDQLQVGHPGHRYEAYGGGVLVDGARDGEGRPLVVTLPGHDRGVSSRLRVFDPEGRLLREWEAFPEYDFSGHVSAGPLVQGGEDVIAVTPGPAPGNPPLVRVFDLEGHLLREFRPALPGGYGAGVSVAAGSLWLTPGPGPGRPMLVQEYSYEGELLGEWHLQELGFENGLRATAVDFEEDDSRLLLFWGTPVSVNPAGVFFGDLEGRLKKSWRTFDTTYGLNLAVLRLPDGSPALVAAPGPLIGYSPHLRIFDSLGTERYTFIAYDDPGACGTHVASLDVNGNGADEIILGEGVCRSRPPVVRILTLDGQLVSRWDAY